MEVSDALDFVSANRNGMLIALKSGGRPQSSNIVYTMGVGDDAGKILISVTDGRAKTKNLRCDPRASLHVNRDDFWAYVVIEADVELTPAATTLLISSLRITAPLWASTKAGTNIDRRWSTLHA